MKIDLHVHTKEMFSGDGKNRNIKADLFKTKMKNNDVGIIAITNHNSFDKEQFLEFKSKNNEYLLLPGVEIDIKLEKESKDRHPLNLIWDPKDLDNFSKLVDNHIKGEVSSEKPMLYKDFKDYFNYEKSIILFDHKSDKKNKKRWDPDKAIKRFKEMKNFKMFDVNNAATHYILDAFDFESIIGSDVQNWDKYEEDAEKLINTRFVHLKNNFTFFLSALRNEPKTLKEW